MKKPFIHRAVNFTYHGGVTGIGVLTFLCGATGQIKSVPDSLPVTVLDNVTFLLIGVWLIALGWPVRKK